MASSLALVQSCLASSASVADVEVPAASASALASVVTEAALLLLSSHWQEVDLNVQRPVSFWMDLALRWPVMNSNDFVLASVRHWKILIERIFLWTKAGSLFSC